MYGWRARVGLIADTRDCVERSFHEWAPNGVSYTTSRLVTPEATEEGAQLLADRLEAEAAKFNGYPIDFIVAAPLMGSFVKGLEWDKACVERMEKASGAGVITAGIAIVDAFKALGVKKIAVVTPYDEAAGAMERKFLESCGFEVTTVFNMDASYVCRHGRTLESADGYFLYRNCLKADLNGAEALLISSMELATMEIIDELELVLKMPVVTGHQAALWAGLRHARVGAKPEKLGKLFQL